MMKKNLGLLLIVIQSLLIGILLFFLFIRTCKPGLAEDATIGRQNETALIDSLENLVRQMRETVGVPPLLDQHQISYLKEKGLANPVEDLRNDLISRGNLINLKGVLGGTMGFYLPEAIHILNSRWVIAYFEDGHIAGAIFLKYKVNEGVISWEVLDEIQF